MYVPPRLNVARRRKFLGRVNRSVAFPSENDSPTTGHSGHSSGAFTDTIPFFDVRTVTLLKMERFDRRSRAAFSDLVVMVSPTEKCNSRSTTQRLVRCRPAISI